VLLSALARFGYVRHQRALQSTARHDLFTIAIAFESYAVDHSAYPSSTVVTIPCQQDYPSRRLQPYAWPVSEPVGALLPLLAPKYADPLPTRDPWGQPYLFAVTADACSYTLVCTGRDRRIDRLFTEVWNRDDFDHDFVFSDGCLVSWWEGSTRGGG
jgi:type II secretory pathway pseudopilin PulG